MDLKLYINFYRPEQLNLIETLNKIPQWKYEKLKI